MRRDFEAFLRACRQRADRKPLVVKGARQTGKTFVLERFGAAEYAAVNVLNFEADPRLATVFEGELDPVRLVRDLALVGRFDPHAALTGAALRAATPIAPGSRLLRRSSRSRPQFMRN